jgi:hypothetical protein
MRDDNPVRFKKEESCFSGEKSTKSQKRHRVPKKFLFYSRRQKENFSFQKLSEFPKNFQNFPKTFRIFQKLSEFF